MVYPETLFNCMDTLTVHTQISSLQVGYINPLSAYVAESYNLQVSNTQLGSGRSCPMSILSTSNRIPTRGQ